MTVKVDVKVNLSNLLHQQNDLGIRLIEGYNAGRDRRGVPEWTERVMAQCRSERGFKAVVSDLLTPPSANHKLEGASVPSYGLTLAHEKLHERLNLCPWAGDCTRVCVLNTGHGAYDSVRRAWLWRTDMFWLYPQQAVWRMGWELGRAVRKHGRILFRPDVNSDLSWHRFLPELGALEGVSVYGYTKNPAIFTGHRMLKFWGFDYAYSHNESSHRDKETELLRQGGKIAVVTSREKGEPVNAQALRYFFCVDSDVDVVDADVSDEWMLSDRPVIGDLSAKGQARKLIGRSGFVVRV